MGEITRKILTKLGVTLALTGIYAWADYKINGEDSAVGIIKKVRKMQRTMNAKTSNNEAVILNQTEYTVE
jgi:hypothetical protein